jgi:CxxC motif-containing protein (DUF1111 family)
MRASAIIRRGALAVVVGLAPACGLLLTDAPQAGEAFDEPIEGLSLEEMALFIEGDAQFGRGFSIAEGLGPIFNNVSCGSCHSGDGRGRPENILLRFDGVGGPQLQDKAIPGAHPEVLPPGVAVSRRLPPPVFGVGMIEAIPEAAILANVDSLDADGDGISGRPNFVAVPPWVPAGEPNGGPGPRVGRFGRKAQVSTLLEQVVTAYHQDMGITSVFLPVENVNPARPAARDPAGDPEVPEGEVRAVLGYIRMLAPPAPGAMTARRQRGEFLFDSIGCARCHVPSFRTGSSPVAALSDVEVRLYSDLLLHDMGDALADNRPDGAASGREWRTAPLWGLRLVRQFLRGEAFYLHDGRARTLEEAIGLHGGEAQPARDRFLALGAADRDALLDFTGSR